MDQVFPHLQRKSRQPEETVFYCLQECLKKSIIVEVKGEKIGVIGASPVDMFERSAHSDYHKDCKVDDLDDTIDDIQEEIDDMKEQGINKIILLFFE